MFEYAVENNIVNGFYTPVQQKFIDNFFIIYYLPYQIYRLFTSHGLIIMNTNMLKFSSLFLQP